MLEGDVSLEDKRWRFNKELKSFGKTHNILILYSWCAFIDKKSKQVKEELFALDGLHLSRKGTLALKKIFCRLYKSYAKKCNRELINMLDLLFNYLII